MSAEESVRSYLRTANFNADSYRIKVRFRANPCYVDDVADWPSCDEAKLCQLIQDADSDILAFDACALLVERFLDAHKPPPEPLALFVLEVIRGERSKPRRRGRSNYNNISRNHIVCMAVSTAMFSIDRLNQTQACHLVVECLKEIGIHLSYEAVKTICNNSG